MQERIRQHFPILAVTPPVRPQKQQSILQPNIIVLGQCMTLKPCTDPDIRFSYFGTGTVTHKIAVEKAGDDRYFLIRIKHGVPPEFNRTGQSIAYFFCIHKQSCINRPSSEDKRQMNIQKWQIETQKWQIETTLVDADWICYTSICIFAHMKLDLMTASMR